MNQLLQMGGFCLFIAFMQQIMAWSAIFLVSDIFLVRDSEICLYLSIITWLQGLSFSKYLNKIKFFFILSKCQLSQHVAMSVNIYLLCYSSTDASGSRQSISQMGAQQKPFNLFHALLGNSSYHCCNFCLVFVIICVGDSVISCAVHSSDFKKFN